MAILSQDGFALSGRERSKAASSLMGAFMTSLPSGAVASPVPHPPPGQAAQLLDVHGPASH